MIGALDAAVGPIKQRERGFGAGGLLCGIAAAQLVQGMARVRSGQAAAWPSVSGRRGCRGSDAQGRVLKIISAKRLEMIFRCP